MLPGLSRFSVVGWAYDSHEPSLNKKEEKKKQPKTAKKKIKGD